MPRKTPDIPSLDWACASSESPDVSWFSLPSLDDMMSDIDKMPNVHPVSFEQVYEDAACGMSAETIRITHNIPNEMTPAEYYHFQRHVYLGRVECIKRTEKLLSQGDPAAKDRMAHLEKLGFFESLNKPV